MRAIITTGDCKVIYLRELTSTNIYDKDGVNMFQFTHREPSKDVESYLVLFEHEVAKVEVLP